MRHLRFPLVPVDPRSVPGPRPSRYDTFGPIRVCRVGRCEGRRRSAGLIQFASLELRFTRLFCAQDWQPEQRARQHRCSLGGPCSRRRRSASSGTSPSARTPCSARAAASTPSVIPVPSNDSPRHANCSPRWDTSRPWPRPKRYSSKPRQPRAESVTVVPGQRHVSRRPTCVVGVTSSETRVAPFLTVPLSAR